MSIVQDCGFGPSLPRPSRIDGKSVRDAITTSVSLHPGRLQTWFSRAPVAHIVIGACICAAALAATDLALLKLLPHLGLQMPDFRRFAVRPSRKYVHNSRMGCGRVATGRSERRTHQSAFLIDQWYSVLEGTKHVAVLSVIAKWLCPALKGFLPTWRALRLFGLGLEADAAKDARRTGEAYRRCVTRKRVWSSEE